MRYRLLGRSGLRVSELCLGTMTFGEDWGFGAPPEECRRQFELFAAHGGNFIDTANLYTNGSSERILGELLEGRRDRFVLATKYTLSTQPDDPNASGNQRKNMVRAVEASLGRLRTDYIDLLWMHAWDEMTPTDEVMRALDDLVRAGKVLHVGVSDTPAWVVAHANTLAELRGWSRFVGLQVQYSLIERTVERELLPMARAFGITVTAWGALGSGVLTGKYRDDGSASDSRRNASSRLNERTRAIAREVQGVAQELGRNASQVALAWVRGRDVPVIPILGARTAAQLEDNLACLDVRLEPSQHARLDEVSRIELGFPHDFLGTETIRKVVHGNTYDLIDR